MTQPPEPRTAAGKALHDRLMEGRFLRTETAAEMILAIEAEAAAPDPVASEATAKCPVCGSPAVIRLADNWQEQVEAGAAIPIVGCGNPWHYFLDREAAAPDPVASPLDVARLAEVLHETSPDCRLLPSSKANGPNHRAGDRHWATLLAARLEGQPAGEERR